jgi:hypothetical protein
MIRRVECPHVAGRPYCLVSTKITVSSKTARRCKEVEVFIALHDEDDFFLLNSYSLYVSMITYFFFKKSFNDYFAGKKMIIF